MPKVTLEACATKKYAGTPKVSKVVSPTYSEFLAALRSHFNNAIAGKQLLTVPTEGLWDIYFAAIPAAERNTNNCNTCRSFMQHWGGAVVVNDEGAVESVLWTLPERAVPTELRRALAKLKLEVSRRAVCGALVSASAQLGESYGGGYEHLAVMLPADRVFRSRVKTAGQRRAEYAERFKDLTLAADSWSDKTHIDAVALFEHGGLERNKKFLEHAKWLLEVKGMRRLRQKPYRDNLLWREAVAAPEGWCSPRSQVIGALLDDLQAGKPVDVVRKAHAAKVDPLAYQRPQAAPKAGTIDKAEELFEKLNLGRSLERRLARASEITCSWLPSTPAKRRDGLFSELRTEAPTA